MGTEQKLDHAIQAHTAELFIIIFIAIMLFLYLGAAIKSSKRHKPWPAYRIVFFALGLFFAAAAVVGPLAKQAHNDFSAHMIGHLLLGMLAPLLLVLSAPVTLLLRTLRTSAARKVSGFLKKKIFLFYLHPIVASILNIGGLWILYTTNIYAAMHHSLIVHFIVHIHVFLAGYLFTASFVYIDPVAHRYSFPFRSIIFILALAGHGILSKYIYAHPPAGVLQAQAETGAMIMYYGGDAIDFLIIVILCYQWYRKKGYGSLKENGIQAIR